MPSFLPYLIVILIGMAVLIRWIGARVNRINARLEQTERDFERQMLDQLSQGTIPPEPVERTTPLREHSNGHSTVPVVPDESPLLQRDHLAQEMPGLLSTGHPVYFKPLVLEHRLETAAIVQYGTGEDLPIPTMQEKARIVRLKNHKQAVIIPENAPREWVEQIMRMYDYVLVDREGQPWAVQRFEEFLADHVFR